LSAEAKALADRSFIETTVRLHRAGEGAAYTGLKPAGTDFGPAISAAERAVETGDLSEVKALLSEEIEHALHERLAHAREDRTVRKVPQTTDQVEAARKRISAEFAFVGFVEGLRQAAHGESGHKE
jgi:hypothetical protein